ncbi:MAG: hypothetical protein KVP17_003004 [Porospora cf. gigantea B]|uniref:uncharacterized protein n=1 Tax=Porospora cf. gigantea B TaxID=2853592 RepID=UPI003571AA74|nr:MAG: hypothetical protein KVP17_003004 [Porospora cf. gigantea B]
MTTILPGLRQHQHRHLTTGTLLLDYSHLTLEECVSESMKFQCNEIRKIVEAVGASLLSAVIVKVVSPWLLYCILCKVLIHLQNRADWGPFVWRPTTFQLMPDVELIILDGNVESLFKFGFHESDRRPGGTACDYQWTARPRPPRRAITRTANCCLGDVPCCTEASQARDQLRNQMFAPTTPPRSTPLSNVASGDVKLCVFFDTDVV